MKVCPVCGTEYGDDAAFCSRDRTSLRSASEGEHPGLIGQLIGDRYQVERRLGQGGMGEVYLARHVLMGRSCALKVMSQALSRDPDAVSRFNREATNASRITHPNVCAVYDFGLTPDGLVYLAMEYVEGRTLNALLEEAGPLPVPRAAALLAQCAHGLQAAHDLGIVHRDLKPDNIMVMTAKDRETAKLVDFGIAKAAEAEPGQRVTRTGFVVGTPEYMSPEQLSGDPLDGRCDQYALALVFYRAITGELPFLGASAQETLIKRLTDPPRPLAQVRPEMRFPAGLQGVMDRALARSPSDRFGSVTEFSHAVHEVTLGDAAPTRRLTPLLEDGTAIPATVRRTRVSSRRSARFLLATGAVLAVGGGAWAVLAPPRAASPTPAPAPPPPAEVPASDTVHRDSVPSSGLPEHTAASAPVPAPPRVAALGRPADSGTRTVLEDTTAATDTLVPDPELFDSPAKRPLAIRQAQRILNSPAQPPRRRAQAAALLANSELTLRHDRIAALRLFQRANALYPLNPNYARMIRQLQDSVPQ